MAVAGGSSSQNLTNFIKQSKDRLKKILERLEWSEDKVKQTFNSNSIASKPTTKSKVVQPAKKSEYPDSCFNRNNLVLGTVQLRELLQDNEVEPPHNFQELQANFNREQKLKIYQHVIENTKKLENNLETPGPEGELSLADILAQKKREEKRKKRKFRKSKPTHIEEVRCLVELQMQALKQFMDKTNDINNSTTKNSKREEYREYNDNNNYKRIKLENREHERGAQSCSKDITSAYRRKHSERSPSTDSHYARKSRRRSSERYRSDRIYSKEVNSKHKRRSRSSSYDRHSRYHQHTQFATYRKNSSKNISPHFDSRHSRAKSPYEKEIKPKNFSDISKRKRRSKSREPSHPKACIKREAKDRNYSKQESLNDCHNKEVDYCKKPLKHKHKKEKKKKHKRDH